MKKYIITDPCYIMNTQQYDTICERDNCNFEGQKFPLQSTHRYSGEPIVFHDIQGTGGDGSCEYNGQIVGVDAGMLCIAYNEKGWYMEGFGAKFETLDEARRALGPIIKMI